jgi:DNA invertase Pin-like site-specific DNA recombinase
MLAGYMRVSSESDRQITDLQRDALLAAVRRRLAPCLKITPLALRMIGWD